MEFLPFPARLTADGVSEFGQATVSPQDNAVDFTGAFVPLLPLGAEAQVEWVLGDKIVQDYPGRVYLSSPDLLRLVGLDADLVRETRGIFAGNTRLPATLAPSSGSAGQSAVRNGSAPPFGLVSPAGAVLPHRASAASMASPCEIIYLSSGPVTLLCGGILEGARRVLLNCEVDFLTLRKLPVKVHHQILLRRGEALVLGEVEASSEENLIALSAYVARLEMLEE